MRHVVVGGLVELVKAETVCPPGKHVVQGRKYGDFCVPNPGPASATKTQKQAPAK